ncbi:MAG: 6-carboxytetrahydropterin synthase [Pseudomonadota bacterium]
MFSVSQTRSFEAAHYIDNPHLPEDYRSVHGHSFVVTVSCSSGLVSPDGWVVNLGELDQKLQDVLATLDHCILNEIEGLETPTLENLMIYIDHQMAARGIELSRVELARPTLGQKAEMQKA